jgi:hypothetical protein
MVIIELKMSDVREQKGQMAVAALSQRQHPAI